MFIGQRGYFGLIIEASLRLSKLPTKIYNHEIDFDNIYSEEKKLELLKYFKDNYGDRDILSMTLNVSKQRSFLQIQSKDSNVIPIYNFSKITNTSYSLIMKKNSILSYKKSYPYKIIFSKIRMPIMYPLLNFINSNVN